MLEEEQVAENHKKGLPHNFSWLKPSRIAGTSAPRRMSEMDALAREGVTHLISLAPEVALPSTSVHGPIAAQREHRKCRCRHARM